MEKKKTYKINNCGFWLKEDLTLNESELLKDIFKAMYAGSKTEVVTNVTAAELKTLLKTVLEPSAELPAGFEYGDIKESVLLEVIKDFFISRVGLAKDLTNFSKE